MGKRSFSIIAISALAAALASCGDGAPTLVTPPTPIAIPPGITPVPPARVFNVQRCFDQRVGSKSVANLIIPDALAINLDGASGFPNGRRLTDPVIDVTLAVLFLDITRHSPALFAGLPVNPAANDLPFRAAFPYLAAAQGTPPLSGTTGTGFDFRADPDSAFVQVDRMGMPAVATALIGNSRKTNYNDGNLGTDLAGANQADLFSRLTELTGALADDVIGLGLSPCAQ